MSQRTSSTRHRLAATAAVSALAATGVVLLPSAAQADDGPKNVIVLIGDGMGYNFVDLASAYEHGSTRHQVEVDPATGEQRVVGGDPAQVYERFPVEVASTTYSASGRAAYDSAGAWGSFDWVASGATDSAAAATALATGVKTDNGVLGFDPEGTRLENLTERADKLGKATGIVSSVPFSHATPAGYAAHNADRNDLDGVTGEYISADYLDVVIGGGHPYFDDDHEPREDPDFTYVSEPDWDRLTAGQTGFDLVEETADFERIAAGEDLPERLFGAVQVGETLQFNRSALAEAKAPGEAPRNEVPDLATLSTAALNVLGQEEDGFFTMIEGGAIDWAGHANSTAGALEETADFNRAVEAAVDWVEENSSWDETLVIVTADHETGYLAGPGADPSWTSISGSKGQIPAHTWHSGGHTNQLVPVFAKGAGAQAVAGRATGSDPLRGAYLDNTDLAKVLLEDLWTTDGAVSGDGIELGATVEGQGGTAPGKLVLSVPTGAAVDLGTPANAGDRLRYIASLPTVAVTDSRSDEQAGAGGWSLSGRAGDLADGNRLIRSRHLGWVPGLREARQGVTVGSPVASQLSGGPGLGEAATLASARGAGRHGTTQLGGDVQLEIPVDTKTGDYRGELRLSLFPVD